MNNLGGAMNQYAYETDSPKELRRVTIRQEIEGQIKHHEEQLKIKKEMLALLDRQPDIEKFMDLYRS